MVLIYTRHLIIMSEVLEQIKLNDTFSYLWRIKTATRLPSARNTPDCNTYLRSYGICGLITDVRSAFPQNVTCAVQTILSIRKSRVDYRVAELPNTLQRCHLSQGSGS